MEVPKSKLKRTEQNACAYASINSTYSCNFCVDRFDSLVERNAHILEHFLKKVCVECDKNLIQIGDEWYERHTPFVCTKEHFEEPQPEEIFLDSIKLEEQSESEAEHENEEIVGFENKIVDAPNDIQSRPVEKLKEVRVKITRIDEGKVEDQFKCIHCYREFTSNHNLNQHLQTHREKFYDCDICKARFKSITLIRTHMQIHGGKPFQCTIFGCKKAFSFQSLLDDHVNGHAGIKNYKCRTCNKSYVFRSSRNGHEKKHNRSTRPRFKCMIENCIKSFSTDVRRKEHLLEHNANTDRFQCDACESSFVTQNRLAIHRKQVHTDPKSYVCTHCGATYRSQNYLNDHLNTHTQAKPYQCKDCGKTFARNGLLRMHNLIHSGTKPNKCDIEGCDRAYNYRIDLKRHKYGAHGIYTKKFTCPVCTKVYPENKLLKRHLVLHN